MTNQERIFKKIAQKFEAKGFDIFVVGGAARDKVLGNAPKDLDLTTNATPLQVEEVAKENGWKVLEVGKNFNISFIVVDGEQFEVATFRKDITRGRKPVTAFGTIEDDVQRRDFTINAMFIDKDGKLIDMVGGKTDIENKIIRAVGDAEDRISDDPLRMLRAIRFSTNLNFDIEKSTFLAIVKNSSKLKEVSRERIILEIDKIKGNFQRFLELLEITNLFEEVFGFENKSNSNLQKGLTTESFVAKIFSLNSISVKESTLVEFWRFTKERARAILVLLELEKLFSGEGRNLRRIKNLLNESQITFEGYLAFFEQPNKHKAEVFWNLELPNFSEALMQLGFKGKDLGIEIDRLDNKFFQSKI